jgi:AraC family transcriptional regulator of adaptative response/methylated-DNA-[protein]-cysteine methyltransferase
MDTMGKEGRWKAVLERDNRFDGAFVYGVHSTGIYCRPSCPARRPRQDQVSFFRMPEAAKQAGFRPCRRCRPDEALHQNPQVNRIQRLCRFIENYDPLEEPLTLAVMGKYVQVSPCYLQRIFKRNMGITPRQYAEACRVRRLKGLFKKGEDVASALYEAGYGSSSRLYEGASTRFGMTPATQLAIPPLGDCWWRQRRKESLRSASENPMRPWKAPSSLSTRLPKFAGMRPDWARRSASSYNTLLESNPI